MEAIQERGQRFNKEMRELDDKQCEMRSKGTAHLTHIMNDYDLLPVHNFKFGSHPDAYKIRGDVWKSFFTQNVPDGCWIGCNMSCAKGVDNYELRTGPYKGEKVIVDGPEYETTSSLGSMQVSSILISRSRPTSIATLMGSVQLPGEPSSAL